MEWVGIGDIINLLIFLVAGVVFVTRNRSQVEQLKEEQKELRRVQERQWDKMVTKENLDAHLAPMKVDLSDIKTDIKKLLRRNGAS